MTLEEALRTYLLTLSTVTAITTTIRPDELAEADTLPAILIELEEELDENDLDGHGGLIYATVIISAISNTKSQARALSEAIKLNGTNPGTGLAGYSGLAGSLKIDAVHNSRSSGYVPEEDGTDSGLHSVDSIYSISFASTY